MESADAASPPRNSSFESENGAANAPAGDSTPVVSPLTHSILSQAVTNAIGQTDPKLAFDMLLVNEHLTSQDASNRSLKEETAFLKQTLVKQTHEQSEMFHYFHEKTDKHLAQIDELERALIEAQVGRESLVAAAKEALENEQRGRAADLAKAQEEINALQEDLRKVHAFVAAKRETEAYIRDLETKLDAQRAAFQSKMQDVERNNLVEQARIKQELLGRMQAAKTELMLRTQDQVESTTHRTLLENEHFTQELAFQSRETEKLLERLDEAQQHAAALLAKNKVLEMNERLMAKKNRYYQKVLARLQHPQETHTDAAVQLQLESPKAKDNEPRKQSLSSVPEEDLSTANLAVANQEKEKRMEIEGQMQRALEWLRVFQRERQFLLSQQDEVVQFLYRALDEAAEARKSAGGDQSTSSAEVCSSSSDMNKRVEELLELAPTTTTMESFGRRVLVSRPALDELSSADSHEVLMFLLEKLRLYQVRIAAVYPVSSASPCIASPKREILERQLGIELPPISPTNAVVSVPSLTSSPLKQKRRVFAHVTAAVDAGNSAWKSKPVTLQHSPQAPLSPQLLAMATNQFNFLTTSSKQTSPTKKRYHNLHRTSLGKNSIMSPPRQIVIQPLGSSSTEEFTPWLGTNSSASIPEWKPNEIE